MNKFEKMALEGRLLGEKGGLTIPQFEALLEIIAAVPNETVAVELLLGIYEEPVIPTLPVKMSDFSSYPLISFVAFNKFKNEVTFNYCVHKEKTAWAPKDGIKPLFEDLTPEMMSYDETAYAKILDISNEKLRNHYMRLTIKGPIDESKVFQSTCSLNKWMNISGK